MSDQSESIKREIPLRFWFDCGPASHLNQQGANVSLGDPGFLRNQSFFLEIIDPQLTLIIA